MASSSTALHHQWDLLTVWGSKAEEDGWPDWRCGSEEHSGKKMGFGFIWFWLIAGNENVHLTSIFFFFYSNDARPSNSLSYRLHLYMFKFKSFQHRFSYPSWSMPWSMPLHFLIVTGRMLVCMVHNCTWARYLPATLLGLAVGQNILRALTFPSSLFPPSSLPFSVC